MIVGIWGNDKSGKTSLALTFPKPLTHFEFDLGGFDRAKWRFANDMGGITRKTYIMPFQVQMDGVSFKQSKMVVGMRELYYQFLSDYIGFINDPKQGSGVIDTATLLWEITYLAYLQEKQENQLDTNGNLLPGEGRLRERLLPIEYKEPNIRMRGILYQAKAAGKNLILTHHSRDVYKGMINSKTGAVEEVKTGDKERSGFNSLGDSTDLMLHTYLNSSGFNCKVCEESAPRALVGISLEVPTYQMLVELMESMQAGVSG